MEPNTLASAAMRPSHMFCRIVAANLSCVVPLAFAAGPLRGQAGAIVFDHVAVMPTTGTARLTNQTVVIADGRIRAMGPAASIRAPAGARHVDGRGATLLPGLWDSHVHLLTTADSTARGSLVERAERLYFPGYVANGVTSVLDLGAPLDPLRALRARSRDTSVVRPRLYSVGQLLGGRNQYAPGVPWNWEVKDSLDGVRAVDTLRAFGVDAIKVHDFLRRTAWIAIATRARESGLQITGHLSPSVSVQDAVAAGQHSIQHVGPELLATCTDSSKARVGAFYTTWIAGGPADFADGSVALWNDRSRSTCDGVLRDLGARGLAITPTVVHRFVERAAARAGDGVQTPLAVQQCAGALRYWTGVAEDKRQRYRATIQEFVRSVSAAGVTLIAGTDGPHECLPAGTALLLELEEMVAAGLTPLAAIASATVNAARELGADSLGTVAVGQLADVLLVDGDPLRDIGALRRLRIVVANGAVYERKSLNAMIGGARSYAR